jgi:hypothetical protein
MAYIGTKPTIGNFQICDAISVVNGQAAYTMQVGSVNVIPQSANHMIVSLNGTIQKPNSSFTVSGSTITFASNLATGDVIDFIQILGDVLDLGVPSDATVTAAKIGANAVTAAKLNNDIISGSTELATAPAATDEFLVSDAGTLKRVAASLVGRGKILQVLNGTVGSTTLSNTDDYIGAGLSITPSSTSSKIQIFVDGYVEKISGSSGNYAELQLRENTTAITTLNNAITYQYAVGARVPFVINFTRSPSTTSAVQYRLYHNEQSGGANYIYFQQAWTLMEVAG